MELRKKNMSHEKKSFTLVELLIVVIIIAIIASIAVPQFFRAIGKAQEGRAKSNLGQIKKAEVAYQTKTGEMHLFEDTSTVSLSIDMDNDGEIDVRLRFFDPNYTYKVVENRAVATPLKGHLGGPYILDLSTGMSNW